MFKFGPWSIGPNEVFLTTKYSLGLVNLKPLVPGHVMVIPRRVVPRLSDLTEQEASDLFLSAQKVGRVIESEYKAESLTVSLQDGPMAGQSVPHVHIHILPRFKGDWMNNDDIYPALQAKEAELGKVVKGGVDNDERVPRTQEEMRKESDALRILFTQSENIWG